MTFGDRLLVGAAVRSLLAEAAERGGGLLCRVDDALWLGRESAEALTFAVRRPAAGLGEPSPAWGASATYGHVVSCLALIGLGMGA